MPKAKAAPKPAMPPEDALFQALSLCRKAGRLVMGFDAVEEAALSGKAWLALTAADASPKTASRLRASIGDVVDVLAPAFDHGAAGPPGPPAHGRMRRHRPQPGKALL